MGEQDQPPDMKEVEEAQKLLTRVETKTQTAEMKAVLKCTKCGEMQDFPTCCGVAMALEDDKLVCSEGSCEEGKELPVPEHCGEKMQPALTKAD
ncbi:MAG: hypothetical protein ACFFCQ_11120 [Promethearchaeota archaeon]